MKKPLPARRHPVTEPTFCASTAGRSDTGRWLVGGLIGLLQAATAPWATAVTSSPTGPVSVVLTWDANTEAHLAGYKVRHGRASGAYAATIDVGNVTRVVLPGFTPGEKYYFAVSAYDTDGLEGPLSDEIDFTPSAPIPPFVAQPLTAPPADDPALKAPAATIGEWRAYPDGSFGFVITANPGQTLAVYTSDDMLNWNLLGTTTNPTGRVQAFDYQATRRRTRYYQVLPQP